MLVILYVVKLSGNHFEALVFYVLLGDGVLCGL